MKKKILGLNIFLRRIPEMPIATSAIVLFFATIVVVHLSLPLYNSNFDAFYSNILAEAHGMLFDIFFMGIIIFWLNKNAERKLNIGKFLNDIDDLRYWDSEEAAFKNVGNIKRLNREGVFKLNLSHCYLRKTTLNKVNLENSNLNSCDLSDCSMISAKLKNTRFNQSFLTNTRLDFADFESAHLSGANLKDSSPIRANFKSANLIKANFEGSLLMEANFDEACLIGCNFKDANLSKANLKTAIGLTLEQLLECKSLFKTELDTDLKLKILEIKPELFK
jgi:hypothetical protein